MQSPKTNEPAAALAELDHCGRRMSPDVSRRDSTTIRQLTTKPIDRSVARLQVYWVTSMFLPSRTQCAALFSRP